MFPMCSKVFHVGTEMVLVSLSNQSPDASCSVGAESWCKFSICIKFSQRCRNLNFKSSNVIDEQ